VKQVKAAQAVIKRLDDAAERAEIQELQRETLEIEAQDKAAKEEAALQGTYDKKAPPPGQLPKIKEADRDNFYNMRTWFERYESRMAACNQNPKLWARYLCLCFPPDGTQGDQAWLGLHTTSLQTPAQWQATKRAFVDHFTRDKSWSATLKMLNEFRQVKPTSVEEHARQFWALAQHTVKPDITVALLKQLPLYNWQFYRSLDPQLAQHLQRQQNGLTQTVMTDADQLLALAVVGEENLKWQRRTFLSQHEQTKQDKDAHKKRIFCTNCEKKHMGGAASCRNTGGNGDKNTPGQGKKKLEVVQRERLKRQQEREERYNQGHRPAHETDRQGRRLKVKKLQPSRVQFELKPDPNEDEDRESDDAANMPGLENTSNDEDQHDYRQRRHDDEDYEYYRKRDRKSFRVQLRRD
jgi:hypothetical protein